MSTMDWSHFWSDVSLFAWIRFVFAAFPFVMMILAGFAVVVTPPLIDHIIRKMDGLKGFAGCLGWCVGVSLALSSAMGLITSILIVLIGLASTGSAIGENPPAQLASLALSVVCGLLGGGLVWLFWRWRPYAPQGVATEEIVAQRYAELFRWGNQWLHGFAIAFIASLVSVVATLPEWLMWLSQDGKISPTQTFIATLIGALWASIDYIWHKARGKREHAVTS
jgi:hypothetical protein